MPRNRTAISEDGEDDEENTPQTQSRTQSRRRRDSSQDADEQEYGAAEGDSSSTHDHMVKDLVRLALSTEFSRIPLRRADISTKVLKAHPRQFRAVFDAAQLALRRTFAMEMVELPSKENVTLTQRRAAQKSQSNQNPSKTTNEWIIRSTLPEKFQQAAIIPPTQAPTEYLESAYIGLYTFIIALILLNGGTLAEPKLERYLIKVNADQSTPVDRTDRMLARMIKEKYLVKVRESNAGEETIDYMVGPRGRVEVGRKGVRSLVKEVYGTEADEELEKRLERSLQITNLTATQAVEVADTPQATQTSKTAAGRPRKRRSEAMDRDRDSD